MFNCSLKVVTSKVNKQYGEGTQDKLSNIANVALVAKLEIENNDFSKKSFVSSSHLKNCFYV